MKNWLIKMSNYKEKYYKEYLDKVAFHEYCVRRYQRLFPFMEDGVDPMDIHYIENVNKRLLQEFREDFNAEKSEEELDRLIDPSDYEYDWI